MIQGIPSIMGAGAQLAAAAVIAIVQSKSYGSTSQLTSHSITLNSAPTSGNVLVLCVAADTTSSGAPAGWTLVTSSVDFAGCYMYWKVSNGTETTITQALAGTASCCLIVLEISVATTVDKSASTTGQGTTTISTGTTAATTAANEIAVAVAGISSGGPAVPSVSSWNNSFITVISAATSGVGIPIKLDVATKILSVTGTQTATATLASAGSSNNSGIIGTFKQ